MTHAYVDYYRELGISPVRQDLSDMGRHFTRRSALYHLLGLTPGCIRDRDVLEFGPGSGDNALYTASLRPRRYVLVDANPAGLADTRRRLDAAPGGAANYEIVESFVESFDSSSAFDVVLAEGMLPHQDDPPALFARIGAHVRPGGIFVVTCSDSVSSIVEICGRLRASSLAPPELPIAERLERLRPVFAPRLATLPGMTRSVDDWILDNITHPLPGRLFSIDDAVRACPHLFDVLGSSPRMTVDWRWYKTITSEPRGFNEATIESYFSNIINLLDYRIAIAPHDPALGRRIRSLADRVFAQQLAAARGDAGAAVRAAVILRDIAGLVEPCSAGTAGSLRLLAQFVTGETGGHEPVAHFGRGQQYLSFVRTH
jgi:SAM-dependent methyltransferase